MNEARADGQYDDVLLVDGGDLYQGMPVSNMSKGAAVIAALDAMDYDAVALGNHEFDWGVSEYCADADATLPGSVFEFKEPLYPEAEAPLDNLTLILFLRQEARDNEGYIAVDTSPRGTCIQGEVPNIPA